MTDTQINQINRGAIWPNKKRTKETHSHYSGYINVEGKEFWLNGWKKDPNSADNAPSMKFSIIAKNPAVHHTPSSEAPASFTKDDFDDDLPF